MPRVDGGGARDRRTWVRARDQVYQEIRSRILHGTLRPNERLIEVIIAEQLGTSRTPVREALQRLAAEGLIVGGRQGWTVKEFMVREIREIFEVRMGLEGFAAALAAERATPEHVAIIEQIHERELALTDRPSRRREQVDLNDKFHAAVLQGCGNERLVDSWARNLAYYFNYPAAARLTDEEAAVTIEQHTRLVAAIRIRDAGAAEQAARAHVRAALAIVIAALEEPLPVARAFTS